MRSSSAAYFFFGLCRAPIFFPFSDLPSAATALQSDDMGNGDAESVEVENAISIPDGVATASSDTTRTQTRSTVSVSSYCNMRMVILCVNSMALLISSKCESNSNGVFTRAVKTPCPSMSSCQSLSAVPWHDHKHLGACRSHPCQISIARRWGEDAEGSPPHPSNKNRV